MAKVFKTVLGLTVVGCLLMLMMSAATPQGLGRGQNPVIKKLGTYRGDTFAGFAEFRVQEVEFDDFGALKFKGEEPYDLLLNVNHITSVHRYEDVKKTDYSCLMYTTHWDHPKLIRQEYKDVLKIMEKAMDEYSK
jgi:hypothetical protein